MASETVVIEVQANFRDNASQGVQKASSSVDRFIEKLRRAKTQTDRLGSTTSRPKIEVMDKATSTIHKITSGLQTIGGKSVRASVRILDLATAPLRTIKNALFSIKGLVATVGAAMATGFVANKALMQPINVADQYTSAKIGFQTLLGEQQGQTMMDNLDKFAKATPFNTSQVIANAQKMLGMGWKSSDIIDDMKTIGDAAAATGKGEEGLSRIVLALSQIKTKGKLSTEELNQLAEAGIRAKGYLAEGLGYGTGDNALMALSKDLEGGNIGAEAAIKAIMQGLKEYNGMMDKTANETVSGLKSQIEDAFEINIIRRWGQGLQDGAKRGFGSIVSLLDASEDGLKKVGDMLFDIGSELSNWAADKVQASIEKIIKLTERADFQDASIFGKGKIIWDEIIAQPFGEWWDSKGLPFFAEKMESAGESIGKGLSTMIKGILGLGSTDSDLAGQATTIGGSFAQGFVKGFDSEGVSDSITKAFKRALSALFSGNWLSNLLLGALTIKGLNLASGAIIGAKNLWYGSEIAGGGAGAIRAANAMGIA
jgi:tape measure domain-containing protein